MPLVRYRLYDPRLAPRRTRLTIPGWGGDAEQRVDGAHEQPWHCIPFTEAATACIEVFYPHERELRVTAPDGEAAFDDGGPADANPPPFRTFGKPYYTYQLLLDLKPEEGFAIRVETHARFFTDTTGTVPIAVPAIIRRWWPMVYFVVFKTPLPGQTHVFRPGEPFLQMTAVQADEKVELVKMSDDEAAEREIQSERIYASRATLSSETRWTSSTDTVFDGTYRRIYGAAKSPKR